VIKGAYAVPSLATAVLGDKFQFERLGNLSNLYKQLLLPNLFRDVQLIILFYCNSRLLRSGHRLDT
jgi:hypothetical protein